MYTWSTKLKAVFNKGYIFESLARNILFLCKMKLLSSIRTPKKVTLRISSEKHEDKLDKDGEAGEVSFDKSTSRTSRANLLKRYSCVWVMSVVQSFNFIVWPSHFWKLTQFNMSCGTYDPLWIIYRLNTGKSVTCFSHLNHIFIYSTILVVQMPNAKCQLHCL